MSQKLKKINVTLPQTLVDEAENIARLTDCDLSEIIAESVRVYVGKLKKINIESLKKGYGEAAKYNLEYAEMCLCADNQALTVCEEKLSESE